MTTAERNTKLAIIDLLEHAADYIAKQSFAEGGVANGEAGQWGKWFKSVKDTRTILGDAALDVAHNPLWKPQPTIIEVIVVDLDALERRAIAASIPDSDVVGLLPYQATVGEGDTYMHVVNESKYNVNTNAHSIPAGEALCGRGINDGKTIGNTYRGTGRFPVVPTCPGCLAKAKNQIAYHLQQKAQAGELR